MSRNNCQQRRSSTKPAPTIGDNDAARDHAFGEAIACARFEILTTCDGVATGLRQKHSKIDVRSMTNILYSAVFCHFSLRNHHQAAHNFSPPVPPTPRHVVRVSITTLPSPVSPKLVLSLRHSNCVMPIKVATARQRLTTKPKYQFTDIQVSTAQYSYGISVRGSAANESSLQQYEMEQCQT